MKRHKKSAGDIAYYQKGGIAKRPLYYNKQQPALYAIMYTFSSTEKHIAKSASIYVYYSSIVKIGDFPFWE